MAQKVRYGENNVVFTEGPFVVCEMSGGSRYRIEAEYKGHHCPALPEDSIYPVQRMLGLDGQTHDWELAARVCDELNQMVRNKQIILDPEFGVTWVLDPSWSALMAAAAVAI